MPRSTFSVGMLQSATPGLGRLAGALAGGNGAYQGGYDQGITTQSRLAQALASARASDASALANQAKARQDNAETDILANRGGNIDEAIAAGTGSTLPLVNAVREYIKTGQRPMRELPGPPTEDGIGAGQAPLVDDTMQSAIAKEIARTLTFRTNVKDTKPDDWSKAQGEYRNQDLSQGIINGRLNRNAVAGAEAAAAGKPLYHANEFGSTDQFTGAVDASNPVAARFGRFRDSATQENVAQAGSARASAGAAAALADQRRQVTTAGKGGPGGKVPVGYRYTTGDDGEVRLEPIPGGPKDPNAQTGKPLPASAAKGYLENQTNLRRAQNALALVQGQTVGTSKGDPDATGLKGYLPNQILNRIDPAGVDTRAAIADLGSLVIHDRSGAAVTASEFPRLAPFVPTEKDDAPTIIKKLKQFEKNYRAIVEDAGEFYKASGYNVPAMRETVPGTPAAAEPTGRVVTVDF